MTGRIARRSWPFAIGAFVLTMLGDSVRAQAPDMVVDTDTQWAEGVYAFGNLTITGATLSVAGGSTLDVTGDLRLMNGARLLRDAAAGRLDHGQPPTRMAAVPSRSTT